MTDEPKILRLVPPEDTNALDVIREFTEKHGQELQAVVLVGLKRDGTTALSRSLMTELEVQFLAGMLSSYAAEYFSGQRE